MKQFSLNEYLANPSRKVITRDGRSVRIICTGINNPYPIVAAIRRADGTDDVELYPKHGHYLTDEECSYDLFFEIDETSEQTKNVGRFDPSTLKPFDKILVRRYGDVWVANLLSHYYNVIHPDNPNIHYLEFMTISNGIYRRCIPYNDDTKHLVGTNEEVPEYYRYWEK